MKSIRRGIVRPRRCKESADGKTLYTTTDDWGDHALFGIDVATGKASKLVAEGTVAGFDVGKKANRVRARRSSSRPADVYAAGYARTKPARRSRTSTPSASATSSSAIRNSHVQGRRRRHGAGLRGQAGRVQVRQEISGRVHHPRRPAGRDGERLPLPLESRRPTRARLRRRDDRLPRLDRLRPGVHRRDLRRLGRRAAGGSEEGLGGGAAQVPFPRRRSRLRARRIVRRLHGQLDRRQLDRSVEMPRRARRRLRQPHDGATRTEELWFDEWEHGGTP